MGRGTPRVFQQDITAAEAIEASIVRYEPDHPVELNIAVDSGPLRSRKIINQLIDDERGLGLRMGSAR